MLEDEGLERRTWASPSSALPAFSAALAAQQSRTKLRRGTFELRASLRRAHMLHVVQAEIAKEQDPKRRSTLEAWEKELGRKQRRWLTTTRPRKLPVMAAIAFKCHCRAGDRPRLHPPPRMRKFAQALRGRTAAWQPDLVVARVVSRPRERRAPRVASSGCRASPSRSEDDPEPPAPAYDLSRATAGARDDDWTTIGELVAVELRRLGAVGSSRR